MVHMPTSFKLGDHCVLKRIIWALIERTKVERYIGGQSWANNSDHAPGKHWSKHCDCYHVEVFCPLVEEHFTEFTHFKLACKLNFKIGMVIKIIITFCRCILCRRLKFLIFIFNIPTSSKRLPEVGKRLQGLYTISQVIIIILWQCMIIGYFALYSSG